MKIYYKIIEVYPDAHQIVVRYYTADVGESDLAIQTQPDGTIARGKTDYALDLPVPAPQGAGLAAFIAARAPAQWLATQAAVKDQAIDTSLAHIMPLLGVQQVAPVPKAVPAVNQLDAVVA